MSEPSGGNRTRRLRAAASRIQPQQPERKIVSFLEDENPLESVNAYLNQHPIHLTASAPTPQKTPDAGNSSSQNRTPPPSPSQPQTSASPSPTSKSVARQSRQGVPGVRLNEMQRALTTLVAPNQDSRIYQRREAQAQFARLPASYRSQMSQYEPKPMSRKARLLVIIPLVLVLLGGGGYLLFSFSGVGLFDTPTYSRHDAVEATRAPRATATLTPRLNATATAALQTQKPVGQPEAQLTDAPTVATEASTANSTDDPTITTEDVAISPMDTLAVVTEAPIVNFTDAPRETRAPTTEAPSGVTAEPTHELTPEPTEEPTATPAPTAPPTEAPRMLPVDGDDSTLQLLVREVSASSYIMGKADDYSARMVMDDDEETSWQFSTKQVDKLSDVYIDIAFSEACTVDELWLKNGFWKITAGKDQYTRNGRLKKIEISFLYAGESDYADEKVVALKDDKKRKDWKKISLDCHENVVGVRIRVLAIYTGSKFKTDVAVSEIKLIHIVP